MVRLELPGRLPNPAPPPIGFGAPPTAEPGLFAAPDPRARPVHRADRRARPIGRTEVHSAGSLTRFRSARRTGAGRPRRTGRARTAATGSRLALRAASPSGHGICGDKPCAERNEHHATNRSCRDHGLERCSQDELETHRSAACRPVRQADSCPSTNSRSPCGPVNRYKGWYLAGHGVPGHSHLIVSR